MTKDFLNVCIGLSVIVLTACVCFFVVTWNINTTKQINLERYQVVKITDINNTGIFDKTNGKVMLGIKNFRLRHGWLMEKYGDMTKE